MFWAGIHSVSAQALVQKNAAKRYEIDAKRRGVDFTKEEGLAASREFVRVDSTYYVGWMIQGIYLSERAADYSGYKNAAEPLEKALNLLEADYAAELRKRTADAMEYLKIYKFQSDYSNTASYLFQAYQNTEQNEKSYTLLRRVQRWNMQKEIVLNAYNMLSWITHRNRFYTQRTYSFLKGDIQANEQLANNYLDTALMRINTNLNVNKTVFPESSLLFELQSVYHYKSILYSYNFEIDSAQYYFALMEESGIFPYNNYGTFSAIQAKFREAAESYEAASMQEAGSKHLQEWAYYSSLIDIYKGDPLHAALNMRDMIRASGSTPGFGWYNIALARACMYEGNIEESQKYLDKAAQFKELHIGTTLGKPHYEFSINLLGLVNKIHKVKQQKFEDKNWWWHPGTLYSIAVLSTEKYAQQYLVANQLAANPERDNVVYRLFATESTVSWDEIWFLIKGYSTNYFYKKFEEQLKTDPRERVYKYFNLYLARIEMEKGQYKKAEQRLVQTLSFTEDIDEVYEKLFLARVYESLAICADKNDEDKLYQQSLAQVYSLYPQLLPYSTLKPQFKLTVSGTNEAILDGIKKYNIKWNPDNAFAPHAYLVFAADGNKKSVSYSVTDFQGNVIVKPVKVVIGDKEEAIKTVAYGLFNIQSLDAQPDINNGG
ncbi:hypothetical protein DBR32_06645 [Taibaiella sp. KBW10]|nr:hypothetical protein DBR32_06645 [Taibaiella sp. KBW10]